jgi:leader peptidase (prepilin peptidase) / N-methyltransferase
MTNAEIIASVAMIGVAGLGAGRVGRGLLGSMRRGVRSPPMWCELSVAGLWAVVAVRSVAGVLPWWWTPVPLLLGWLGVLLATCDVVASRLPDALTLPAYPVAMVVLGWAVYWSRAPDLLVGALLGFAVFTGTYVLIRLVSPAAMGPGDVKLAGSLGLVVGAVSVPAVLLSMIVAALLTLAMCGWSRWWAVPHGPAMLVPTWLVTALSSGPVWGGDAW